jgi:predicted phosphodiesterase
LQTLLIVPDCHVPYEDRRAFELMLEAGRRLKPHTVVLLGDFADFYSVSSHSKNPERARDLAFEVEKVHERLRDVRALGARRLVYIAGNHEDRLSRYLMDKAPELFGTVKLEEVLGLKALGFEYVPYRRAARVGKLNLTHDVGNSGATAHTRASALFGGNVVIGHTHRLAYAVQGDAQGDAHVAAMFGWLGDRAQVDYLHAVQAAQWAHGFGVGYLEPDTGVVHVVPVPIVRGRCVVEGQLVELPRRRG